MLQPDEIAGRLCNVDQDHASALGLTLWGRKVYEMVAGDGVGTARVLEMDANGQVIVLGVVPPEWLKRKDEDGRTVRHSESLENT